MLKIIEKCPDLLKYVQNCWKILKNDSQKIIHKVFLDFASKPLKINCSNDYIDYTCFSISISRLSYGIKHIIASFEILTKDIQAWSPKEIYLIKKHVMLISINVQFDCEEISKMLYFLCLKVCILWRYFLYHSCFKSYFIRYCYSINISIFSRYDGLKCHS